MLNHRRIARPLALACATAAVAAAPSTALARPAIDPSVAPSTTAAEPETVVREIQTGGDQTVALILSGGALLVAFAGAGYSGSARRRVDRIAHPQV